MIKDCRDVFGECFEELRSGTMGQEFRAQGFRGSLDCRVPYFKGFCPWGRRLRIGEFWFEGLKAYGLQRSGSRSKSPTYPGVYLESQGEFVRILVTPISHIATPITPIINLLTKSPDPPSRLAAQALRS